jgi:hypothetical protein
MVDGIAGGPLGIQAGQPRVPDQALVAGGGGFEPVHQVPAIAGPRRRLREPSM